MDEEIHFHIAEQTRRYVAQGVSPDDARRLAMLNFGHRESIRERGREARGWTWLDNLVRDTVFAARSLWNARGFTAIAVVTLALGIGMNTAMFSLLNTLLLRPLNFPEAGQLFRVYDSRPHQTEGDFSMGNYADLADACTDIAEVASFRFWGFTVSDSDRPADVPNALRVSVNYFNVIGLPPAMGRGFVPEDGVRQGVQAVVVSHRYWQSYFTADPDIVGRVIYLDGEPAEVVGVLPAANDIERILGPISIFCPIIFDATSLTNRIDPALGVVGRYRTAGDSSRLSSRLEALAHRLSTDYPVENSDVRFVVASLQSTTLRGVGRTMTLLLLGLSFFVLLTACANLTTLLVARAMSRTAELSLRGALGASRGQLVRPIVLELALLAALGGLAATLVWTWASDWLAARFGGANVADGLPIDARVLGFSIGVTALTAFLFGIAPTLWASRTDPGTVLKGSTRGTIGGTGQGRLRVALVSIQCAVALVLLSGSGFFIQGVRRLLTPDTGWQPAAVVSGVLNLASDRYNAAEPIIAFHEELTQRLRALPGVENAAVCFEIPLYASPARRAYRVEGRPPLPPGQDHLAYTNGVSASYFDTVGTRLLRGRLIDATDRLTSRPVVVINESMADALFPGSDPLGARLGLAGHDDPHWAEIVGVVEDAPPQTIASLPTTFQVYKPFPQEAWQYVNVVVRASNPALASGLPDSMRQVVAELDGDQPLINVMTAPDRNMQRTGVWRAINQILTAFAGLGLVLAVLGIYGVITRLVMRRIGEFGLRIALGACAADVSRLVIGEGLRMMCVGAALGLVGAVALERLLSSSLPAFSDGSTLAIGGAVAVLGLAVVAACWLPARRASRINPVVALRAE